MKKMGGGWRMDLDMANWHVFDAMEGESEVLAMRGHYPVKSFDPRQVLKVENQKQQGACQGHAISSCLEWCACVESGDTRIQLSRAMGYYETQRLDNILRRS